MNSTQTDHTTQNSGKSLSPFDQIKELERREKERTEKELAAMQKEKEEVSQSVAKKEELAAEEMKAKAKEELKAYSESELTQIMSNASKEAQQECKDLETAFGSKKGAAVETLVSKALEPGTFSEAA